jgi:hypothetical protein
MIKRKWKEMKREEKKEYERREKSNKDGHRRK